MYVLINLLSFISILGQQQLQNPGNDKFFFLLIITKSGIQTKNHWSIFYLSVSENIMSYFI